MISQAPVCSLGPPRGRCCSVWCQRGAAPWGYLVGASKMAPSHGGHADGNIWKVGSAGTLGRLSPCSHRASSSPSGLSKWSPHFITLAGWPHFFHGGSGLQRYERQELPGIPTAQAHTRHSIISTTCCWLKRAAGAAWIQGEGTAQGCE